MSIPPGSVTYYIYLFCLCIYHAFKCRWTWLLLWLISTGTSGTDDCIVTDNNRNKCLMGWRSTSFNKGNQVEWTHQYLAVRSIPSEKHFWTSCSHVGFFILAFTGAIRATRVWQHSMTACVKKTNHLSATIYHTYTANRQLIYSVANRIKDAKVSCIIKNLFVKVSTPVKLTWM